MITFHNVSSLIPIYNEQNYKFSSFLIGLLLSSYCLSFVLVGPIVGSYLGKFGRRRAIIWGMLIISVSSVLFGMSTFIKDRRFFYSIAMLGRVL